jgi:hypothetical protein
MASLSQHAGGGSVSELFLARDYGGTGQCDVQNLGYAGGKIEFFMQAKFEPDTGASDSRVWSWLSSTGAYWNLLVQVYDSDHATVERRNKMRVLMQNNTGTAIIDLLSNIEVADNNLHYIFFTGDPATGNFEYTINGNDADDTTYSNRLATSGTMETGANDDLGFMGYVNTTNNRVKGSVAYVGLRFDHATAGTYSDVFNEVGGVTLDLGGFAQPQWDWFSNVGQPNVNWGTNTSMTFTGSATDLWVRRVDNLGLGLDTTGNAVAADIATGKIAWVNGVSTTGTSGNGTLLFDQFTDADSTAITAHQPTFSNPVSVWEVGNGTWTITSGNLQQSVNTNTQYMIAAETGQSDVDCHLIYTPNASGEHAARIILRYLDSNNFWAIELSSNDNTLKIRERNAGSWNERASVAVTTSAGEMLSIRATASGNTITAYCLGVTTNYASATFNNTETKHGIGEFRDPTTYPNAISYELFSIQSN